MYYGARYYNAEVGRFTSADPAAGGSPKDYLFDPQQLNLYAYARNNPLKYTDPGGNAVFLVPVAIGVLAGVFFYDYEPANSLADEEGTRPASDVKNFAEAVSPEYDTLPQWRKTTTELVVGGAIMGAGSRIVAKEVVGSIAKPGVSNSKLNNIVNDLYKGVGKSKQIGSGSTADAIRNELITGKPTYGKFHSQKGSEYVNALRNWLNNNPTAISKDRHTAKRLLQDLRNALKHK